MKETAEQIKTLFLQQKLKISDNQAEKFLKYYNFLVQENQKFNLTAITDFEEVVKKHFIDCAVCINYFNGKVLDVGSGAGFPGVVLAILNSNLSITLLDSLNKRVNFLNELINLLDLKNVNALHCRIEDFKGKEQFDLVTARAVAELSTLSEYLLPFVKINGRAVIFKGADVFSEVEKGQNAINLMGGQVEEISKFELFDMFRSVIVLRKIKPAPPKYPRGGNLPRKIPL